MTRAGKGVGRFWKGGIDTTAENLRACLGNIERARMALNAARDARLAHGPGTVEGNAATYNMHRLHAEVVHWTQSAKEWQEELDDLQLVAAELAAKAQRKLDLDAVMQKTLPPVASALLPGEREPGSDDDDGPESPYAELGGAVGGAR